MFFLNVSASIITAFIWKIREFQNTFEALFKVLKFGLWHIRLAIFFVTQACSMDARWTKIDCSSCTQEQLNVLTRMCECVACWNIGRVSPAFFVQFLLLFPYELFGMNAEQLSPSAIISNGFDWELTAILKWIEWLRQTFITCTEYATWFIVDRQMQFIYRVWIKAKSANSNITSYIQSSPLTYFVYDSTRSFILAEYHNILCILCSNMICSMSRPVQETLESSLISYICRWNGTNRLFMNNRPIGCDVVSVNTITAPIIFKYIYQVA